MNLTNVPRYLYAYQYSFDPEFGVISDSEWVVSDQFFEDDAHFESVLKLHQVKMRYHRLDWSRVITEETRNWKGELF